MAEAHQAVAFSFSVTHEGVAVNFDNEVLKLIFNSGVRSWKKRIVRLKNGIKNGVFPGSLGGLLVVESAVAGSYHHGYDPSFGLIDKLVQHMPSDSKEMKLAASLAVGFGGWATVVLSVRQILRLLFMYQGWMFEERGAGRTVSIPTRVWLLAVKVLTSYRRPMLYSFQGALPYLPLPSVDETLTRYLRSVRPLMDDDQYHRMERLAREFRNGIARKLQRYLTLKRMWSTNYVSDWWEEYVYLRGRSPIMVNSNFYGIDAILRHPTSIQAARAANIVYSSMLFRRALERQEIEPIMVQGMVPLCSSQYERIFNTTRIPGIETDKIVHLPDSTHIAVYCGGKFWKVNLYHKGRLLKPAELEIIFGNILDDTSDPERGEEKLAALTAGERATWAKTRQQYFAKGMNKISLDAIEKAAFFLSFDDEEYNYDPKDHTKLDHYGRILLHGKGYDRWFDKSFTICVGKNGKIGFNAEHSWADAPIMGHVWEYVLGEDMLSLGYKSDGHCIGTPEFEPPLASRLRWELPEDCINIIESSNRVAQALLNDVDLRLYVHDSYGKGLMKKFRVSPDAYIQMALQLAYYRDAGKFNLTYEASMTRLYREGRTETVRPCTIESCAWVRSMDDLKVSNKDRFNLLRTACQTHQRGYQDAMCGKGIDRHLFCLYVISKYLETDSPFLKEVLSEPWRLSTSQTPHGQTSKLDLTRYPDCISAGGGFGPVADDGYGVSYIVAGENLLFFHISCKKSSPQTDSDRFSRQIEKALADMRELFENKDK